MTRSTSARTASKLMFMLCRARAATPSPSAARPRTMCSVPTTLWPSRRASSWANTTTFWARSVNRPNMLLTAFFLVFSSTANGDAFPNQGRPQHVPLRRAQLPPGAHLQVSGTDRDEQLLQDFRLQSIKNSQIDAEPYVRQHLQRLLARHDPGVGQRPVGPRHPVLERHLVAAQQHLPRFPLLVDDLPRHIDQVLDDIRLRMAEGDLVRELKDVPERLRPLAVQAAHHQAETADGLNDAVDLAGGDQRGQVQHQAGPKARADVGRARGQV